VCSSDLTAGQHGEQQDERKRETVQLLDALSRLIRTARLRATTSRLSSA